MDVKEMSKKKSPQKKTQNILGKKRLGGLEGPNPDPDACLWPPCGAGPLLPGSFGTPGSEGGASVVLQVKSPSPNKTDRFLSSNL